MNDFEKVLQDLQKIHENCRKMGVDLDVDNTLNLQRRVTAVKKDRDKYKSEIEEIISLVGLSGYQQRGNAKSKIKKMMLAELEDNSSIPEIFLAAPSHWMLGKPKSSKCPQGLAPMLPSTSEKFLRREVWPYLRDLMNTLHYYTEIERVRILETLEEKFVSEAPKDFLSTLVRYVHNIDEKEEEEEIEQSIPLATMLNLCVGYYPDQLLKDCRERGDEAGYVSRNWVDNLDTKYATANTAEGREEIARKILVRFIYRVSGGEGIPLPEMENSIACRLSTERWNVYGSDWIVTEETRLQDLLEPLTTYR